MLYTTTRKALFCLLFCLPALALGSLSPQAFTEQFISEVRQSMPDTTLHKEGALSVRITQEDGNELAIYLDNAYQLYMSGQGTSEEIISQHVASVAETLSVDLDAQLDMNHVLPVIKNHEYLEGAQSHAKAQRGEADDKTLLSLSLNEDLVVMYVLDTPTSMRFLTSEDLEELSLDSQALHRQAVNNLRGYIEERGGTIHQLDTDGQGKIFVISVDDIYETSGLLTDLPEDKSLFPIAGDPVVFVPARGTLLVVGDQDKPGLELAAYIAEHAFKDMAYSISPHGYQRTKDRWVRYR